MRHATRNSATCRLRTREIPLRAHENRQFWQISCVRNAISRVRENSRSIFLSNRSTWSGQLLSNLTCRCQMYCTRVLQCFSCIINFDIDVNFTSTSQTKDHKLRQWLSRFVLELWQRHLMMVQTFNVMLLPQ